MKFSGHGSIKPFTPSKLGVSSFAALVTIFSLSQVSNAQQTATGNSAKADDELSEVVVTGSRIRRAQLDVKDSTLPYTVIDSEELEGRQVTNLVDALRDLPLASVSSNRGPNTQFGDNYSFVNLLSVGSQRTLTLLNGRRVVPSNQGTVFVPGNASGAQVDVSLINPLIVQRTDIITGSGGAVYGADAIAGVINVITRSDFEGASVDLSAGVTEIGDGENYRISGIWGKNFLDGRANITVSGEFYDADIITTSADEARRYLGSSVLNNLDGSLRDPNPLSAADAANALRNGFALPLSFIPANRDGVSSVFYGPLTLTSPIISKGGLVMSNSFLSGFTSNSVYIPTTPVAATLARTAADPQGFAFFAPSTLPAGVNPLSVVNTIAPGTNVTGLSAAQLSALALQLLQRNRPTPFEYSRANPGINPLLFVGLFGPGANSGLYPTVLNTDPATNRLFPRVAVPLQFDRSGTLVPFNIGNITPPLQGRLGSTFGSQGYDSYADGHQQIRSAVQRANLFLQSRFDFTDNIRTKGEYFYTDITFDSVSGTQANSATGSTTAGTRPIPVFINQNPFLNAASKATLANLRSQGWTPTAICSNGVERASAALCPAGTTAQEVFYMGRALSDLTDGPNNSGNDVKTWRVAQTLEGEFKALDRDFYWEIAGGYGRAEAINRSEQLLDIEFALAVDVVTNAAGQQVCRQQTLAAPESIALRNPQIAFINTGLSLVPTAAQVAACKPLNLFGEGAPSRDAISYVKTDGGTTNVNTQTFYSGNLGTSLFELPAGPISINVQAEYREEDVEFTPGASAAVGAARNTLIRPNRGSLEFEEQGAEVILPIFGRDFSFPLLRAMELNGAFRRVERSGTTTSPFFPVSAPGTKDDTYTIGVRWKPFEDLTLRYNRSTSVRSASLVELFSAPGSGFSNQIGNVCTNTSIGTGPNPAVRRKNCIEAVKKLGLAANDAAAETFLASFTGTGGFRPAASTGNPFLLNEEGNAFSAGLTYEPSWMENFTVSADFVSLDIANEVGLLSPALYIPNCFDSDQFPNTIVNGTPVCDLFTFGVLNNGVFILPATNPLTGNPVAGGAPTNTPALIQAPFESAYFQFPNFNQGARKLRSTNLNAFYRFGLGDLFGGSAKGWGDVGIRANVYWAKVLDLYADGVNLSGRSVGSGLPEYQARVDLSHRVGRFSHTLQWIWVDGLVGSVFADPATYPEQSPTYVQPAYRYMNYYAAYEISNNFRVRLSVSNLTDTQDPFGQFGSAYDNGIGREFTLGVNYRF